MTDTTDKLIIQSETQGVQQSTDQLNKLKGSMDGVTVSAQNVEKSTGTVDSKFAALERRLGTAAGQSAKFEAAQKTINAALAANPGLQARANEALSAAEAKFIRAGDAANDAAKSTGLASYQVTNLFRQFQDVGVSLAGGQSPFTVLVQQGGQIADVFSTGNVTAKGFFEQVASGAARVITPLRLVGAGAIGLGAAALYFGNSWQEASAEVDRALTGIGRRTGTTAKDVSDFTKANATALGLSVSEARNVALEFTKTGNVAISGLKGVGEAIRGYSLLTGQDATEATKTFTNALSGDLLKGIEDIDRRYGALNSSTLEYIRTLIDQGDKTKALQVYIDAIEPANRRATESVGVLSRAWQGFKNVVSNIASGPAPTSLQDQIAEVQQQIASRTDPRAIQARGGTGDLSGLYKQLEELQGKLNEFNAGNVVTQLNAMSKAAFENVNSVLPQIDAIRKLDEAIKSVEAAQNTPGVQTPANSDAALVVLKQQRDLQQESLDTTVRQAQVVKELQAAWGGVSSQTALALNNLKGQLQVAQQVTAAGQMQAQSIATYNSLLAQGVASSEAQLIASKQFEVSQASATSAVLRQVEALKDQNAMIRAQQNGTEASTAAAIAYKNAIESGADASAASALSMETLTGYTLRAAAAAKEWVSQLFQAGSAARQAAGYMDQAALAQATSETLKAYAEDDARLANESWDGKRFGGGAWTNDQLAIYNAFQRQPSTEQSINNALRGGVDSAISTLSNTSAPSFFYKAQGRVVTPRDVGLDKGSQSDITGAISQLFDLKFAQAGDDKSKQAAVYEEQLKYLQSQPQTIDVLLKIANLTNSLNDLKKSTDTLNATQQASLNPLYNGRDALKVGYYHAASGLEMIAQGPPAGDQVPFHAMVNGGEHIKITPAGQQTATNDNSKTIINNNNFVFNAPQSKMRRSDRQAAQGFGQMVAGLS